MRNKTALPTLKQFPPPGRPPHSLTAPRAPPPNAPAVSHTLRRSKPSNSGGCTENTAQPNAEEWQASPCRASLAVRSASSLLPVQPLSTTHCNTPPSLYHPHHNKTTAVCRPVARSSSRSSARHPPPPPSAQNKPFQSQEIATVTYTRWQICPAASSAAGCTHSGVSSCADAVPTIIAAITTILLGRIIIVIISLFFTGWVGIVWSM